MSETPELLSLAIAAADAAGIPREIFLGLIKQESGWKPAIRSGAGAIGLTQVMPMWASPNYAASIGMDGLTVEGLSDPQTNLTAGSRILANEFKRFGSWELALMAYNGGSGNVNAAIKRAGTTDPQSVSDQLKAAETRGYWQSVLKWANVYAGKMSETLATIENAATDVAENIKDSGLASPVVMAGLALLGLAWAASAGVLRR